MLYFADVTLFSLSGWLYSVNVLCSFDDLCKLISELDHCCSSHKASPQVDLYLKEHEHLTR